MEKSQNYYFRNRSEWRSWLKENHDKESTAWLIIQKKKSKQTGIKYEEAVEEALCYGWIDSKMNRIDEDTFRQRFTPRKKNSVWSKSNKNRVEKLIKEGLMKSSGLTSVKHAKENGMWEKAYSSQQPPETPPDLEEALKKNNLAHENFQAFSNSTKLIYVNWVESAKRMKTRQRRISEVVKKAEKNIKPS